MLNYKEILRQHNLGYSQRCIASSGVASRNKVREVLEAAEKAHVGWPLGDDITNEDLRITLFPELEGKATSKNKKMPNFSYIHAELAKPGVTLTLLWEEYSRQCYEEGWLPYMPTQFNEKYRKWAKVTKATMRIHHKPGDAMQVDWAGTTIPIFDSTTGAETAVYLFVAVLPCSCYAYAEACSDMKLNNWLTCHVHAYNYFGGVTRLLIPDNLKTGVTKNTRYDTVLNRSYQELATYYGTSIVPARVLKPKDKSLAEGTVKFASTWIIAALRERKFFSVAEAKDAVAQRLNELNGRPFQKLEGTRKSLFLKEEKEFLLPLPKSEYEPSIWNVATVGNDYLITDGLNKYSVPFDLIGEKVDIRLTPNIVEIFYRGSRVATHQRKVLLQREPIVKQDHMPEAHRKYLNYDADKFIAWAATLGPQTLITVKHFLSEGKAPEQGYKACVSLTSFADKYGKARLENACGRILMYSTVPSIRNISLLLKNGQDIPDKQKQDSIRPPKTKNYGITRGAAYFKGASKHD